ncbi:MAG: response regulator [bacterium]|nr:response regulator [bacterium]MDY4099719.1 response regulator [Lachnospiraceae bacterium]
MEKMRILAIDDNTVNLATLEQELKSKYEVIPMISGRRAIKYLYREQVDLILLDVEMPIMDGIETLKEIRAQENGVTVPVIFLTAKKDKATVIDGAKLGIMDYITKPFDPEDLHERIERVFKRLGVLPMEEEELYQRVLGILNDMKDMRSKQAIVKTEEVLNYQIDEELSGRIRNVLGKLKQNNIESAVEMMERVVDYLDKRLNSGKKNNALPIAESEISVRILYALDDLSNFKRKEAIAKLKDLQRYDIGSYVYHVTEEVVTLLDDYDEVKAEEMLRTLLADLKNAPSSELSKLEIERSVRRVQGYHSTFKK